MAYREGMDAAPSAATVGRVLVALDRARASGLLRVMGFGRAGGLLFEEGRIVGAAFDRRVAVARPQVVEGLDRACQWEDVVLRLEQEHATADSLLRIDRPVPAREIALRVLQRSVERLDAGAVRALLGGRFYRVSLTGRSMLERLDLSEQERAAARWLERGGWADDVLALPHCGLPAYRFVGSLKLLGWAAETGGAYRLLLRKRRQLRQDVSPRELLDLPAEASGPDARRALRRLVGDLHPDRFGERAPAAVRHASGEVVSALVAAEAAIASARLG